MFAKYIGQEAWSKLLWQRRSFASKLVPTEGVLKPSGSQHQTVNETAFKIGAVRTSFAFCVRIVFTNNRWFKKN